MRMTAVGGGCPTNGAVETITLAHPYTVDVTICGTADILFHGWNCESIDAKAKAPKGSKAKKQDDIESYVYRDEDGIICLPGSYIVGSIVHAAKFRQDPRSPRKSAMDLYRAGVVCTTPLAPLGEAWDYEHRCRVTVQRQGITRTRPAFRAGWKTSLQLLCLVPEYIRPDTLHEVLSDAGRLIGVGDYRPTYGRFQVTRFEPMA